jgi:hypothetical protein
MLLLMQCLFYGLITFFPRGMIRVFFCKKTLWGSSWFLQEGNAHYGGLLMIFCLEFGLGDLN